MSKDKDAELIDVGEVDVQPGQYRLEFKWPLVDVHVTADRIQDKGDCELYFFHQNGDGRKLLHMATAHLLSSTYVRDFAKALSDRIPNLDWQTVLTTIQHHTMRKAREGEVVRELWTNAATVRPPEYLLRPLVLKNLPTVIFGEKGAFKSGIAQVVYICLALGWRDNPLGFTVTRPVKTLLLDWEVDGDVSVWNLRKLQAGLGIPHLPLYHRHCVGRLVDLIPQIREQAADLKTEAVILDSIGPAVGGDLNDPGEALRFITAVNSLQVGSLMVGQTSKDREAKTKSVYGSAFYQYYARAVFEVRNIQEESENKASVGLFQTFSNLTKRLSPMCFDVTFSDDTTKVEYQNVNTVPEFLERRSLKVRLMECLKSGKLEVGALVGMLPDTNEHTIRTTLSRYKETFKHFDDGWGLLTNE